MFKQFIIALGALVAATAFAAVDVNKASQAELESIKGIGPTISTQIRGERQKGPFKDWSDLTTPVKGVGRRAPASSRRTASAPTAPPSPAPRRGAQPLPPRPRRPRARRRRRMPPPACRRRSSAGYSARGASACSATLPAGAPLSWLGAPPVCEVASAAQPKKARTSSHRAIVSRTPRAISSRV